MAILVASFRGMRRTRSARAEALRRAQQAKQLRDAKRLQRERRVEQALADYFENTQLVQQITEQAEVKAAKVIADGEQAAREPRALAASAVGRLEQLGETRTAIAELTGLSLPAIRDLLATVSSINSAEAGGKP